MPDAKRVGYFIFGVVRNTYERVVSMYFNRWLNIDPNGPMVFDYKPAPWDKYGQAEAFTFNEFVTLLCGSNKIALNKEQSIPLWACNFYDKNGIRNPKPSDDKHMRSQWDTELLKQYWKRESNNNVETYIHLDKLGDELPKLYEEKIGISASKIKKILSDRKMSLKKGSLESEGKLDNYDFLMDTKGYDILKNGVPSAKNMITEFNIRMIYLWYKEEIVYHNFGFQHLL
jgi:hypothetical protein